jgi:hypothetical protein
MTTRHRLPSRSFLAALDCAPRFPAWVRAGALGALVSASLGLGCGGTPAVQGRELGQSAFESVSPQSNGGASDSAGAATGAGGSASTAGPVATTSTRTVEETDLYRLEGNRLYYLNGYRGLMVFDVTDVDHPTLLGRSPMFGSPVEMIVRNGIATVVVADWYGNNDDGSPFHGSIVRGIDATDPTHMRILGDAKLGGWVSDTRVVGDVLYAVSQEWGWDSYYYGAGLVSSGAPSSSTETDKVVVSSVSFAGGQIVAKGRFDAPGSSGLFSVTPTSILFAHTIQAADGSTSPCGYYSPTRTALDYIDISDPSGNIAQRGHAEMDAVVQGWGTDNGRWNLDFADGKTAHALGVVQQGCGGAQSYVMAAFDFTNADAPTLLSSMPISGSAWMPAARFDSGRMYLSPTDPYYYSSYYAGAGAGGAPGVMPGTPIQVYDLSDSKSPKLAGTTYIAGSVWSFIPAGNRLFALGNDAYDPLSRTWGQAISLRYIDVSDAANPQVMGTSTFGDGWAWTPAAGTFKAFTKDDSKGLVVLPFSGWSSSTYSYNNGLQLIEFTPSSLRTAGAAQTKGWVERGIFVGNRLVSLSDLALSVVDYSVTDQPKIVTELTLARNVIDAKPNGDKITELSTDWWGNDIDHSELRILPLSQADENSSDPAIADVAIEGTNAQVFHNGDLAYVATNVREQVDCSTQPGQPGIGSDGKPYPCYTWHQQVQVVDTITGAKLGKVSLPDAGGYYYSWGWYGCYDYDWWWGNSIVQVADDALAFQLWAPQYGSDGRYIETQQSLFLLDLSDPNGPTFASTRVLDDPQGWWGNIRAVGDKLYTSHYEWERQATWSGNSFDPGVVRYYLDEIDIRDRQHPLVGAKINVPGILVGGSESDPSILYTIDYRWYGTQSANDFDVIKINGGKAYLEGIAQIPGWVGTTQFANGHAYMSVQHYSEPNYNGPAVQLYQIDLGDPNHPIARSSTDRQGWGWLLGIQGDRALVTSGWGNEGVDIYRLADGAPPAFDQFVRTRGWGATSLARQGNQIFLASGYWGVQTIDLGN